MDNLILQITELWIKISEVDPTATVITDYDVKKQYDEIEEAFKLDESNITALLLLDYFAFRWFKENSFSLEQLLENSNETQEKIYNCTKLKELLNHQDIINLRNDFIETVTKALKYYEVAFTDSHIKDYHNLAILRRDALRSMSNLTVHQFLRGETEPKEYTPQYSKYVYEWWNINSLLRASCSIPSGISLNLIKPPDGYQSYFVFSIRNGGNLYLLTDSQKEEHPLQNQMRRRPDRLLEERAGKNWFPYYLLDIERTEDNRLFFKDSKSTVLYQQEAFPLKRINELEFNEIVWVSMMFDLIEEKFWKKSFQTKELSYTGEDIFESSKLLKQAIINNLPVKATKTINCTPLTIEEVKNASTEEIGTSYDDHNKWLLEKYGSQVDPEVLNISDSNDQVYLLSSEGLKNISVKEWHSTPDYEKRGTVSIEHIDKTKFGSKNSILADRKFLARYNMAKAIQFLANKEYEERKDQIKAWYEERIIKNSNALLDFIKDEHLWRPILNNEYGVLGVPILLSPSPSQPNKYNMMHKYNKKDLQYSNTYSQVSLDSGYSNYGYKLCYINATKFTFIVTFNPQLTTDLLLLTGLSTISELPDVLQNWRRATKYSGNHILTKIDPIEWALKDPWTGLHFNISIYLSARAFKKLSKKPE
jgi:hypothetical protein